MRTSSPLVSVITPVHNGAAFLRECVESVVRQTYEPWEYVIVDNASTDGSRAIAEEYAARDGRIRVLSTPSLLAAVDSQNFALEQVPHTSVYCKVVHADDWMFPECLARMVEIAEAHPTIGIVSAYRLEGTSVTLDGLPYPSTFVPGREIARRSLLGGSYLFGSPTSLLLRSDIVRARRPFYTDRAPWTDMDVCYQILRDWDFGFVHQVLTYTRYHEEAGSAASARINASVLGNLILLTRYGPEFLTEDERKARIAVVMRRYREFLARSVIRGRDRAFWRYHLDGLAAAGHPLRPYHVILTALRLALTWLARPGASAADRLRDLVRPQPGVQ